MKKFLKNFIIEVKTLKYNDLVMSFVPTFFLLAGQVS